MLFKDLFVKKKHKKEKIYQTFSTDYMKVISASEIADMEEPPFNQSKWSSKESYRLYLESVQSIIEEYEKNGKLPEITLNEEIAHPEECKKLVNFRYNFLDFASYIDVEKTIDGKYKVCCNGRHRMYVAKKYGLKLLVHVSQEQR